MNCDHEAARLLPWFVTGAVAPADAARVQAHLRECAVCAADEQRERRLRSLMQADSPVEQAPQPGLQRLLDRIGSGPAPGKPRSWPVRWLAAAVLVQALGLGVLATVLWDQARRFQEPRFATLSGPSAAVTQEGVRLRVVFDATMTLGELQALLASIPAQVVEGPSAAGVYTVRLRNEDVTAGEALARLRDSPGVLFAE